MISAIDKLKVVGVLDSILGAGYRLKSDENSYHCPFCHHHKKKLQVNLETQKWHCWVCDVKGRRIRNLLKKLDASKQEIKLVDSVYGFEVVKFEKDDDGPIDLRLPREFISLKEEPKGFNPNYKHAILYLEKRGIGIDEIIKYNMGFCNEGVYSNRIIIPSYDERNRLNFFTGRSFHSDTNFKYKNPPISKNIIMFENQINWKLPITICEGVFDAIAIKRNAIPIMGKFIPKKLKNKIFVEGVREINILLDVDAQEQALKYVDYFQKQGIMVKNIIPNKKDASEMGFGVINNIIKKTEETGFTDLILQKLKTV